MGFFAGICDGIGVAVSRASGAVFGGAIAAL